MAILIWHVRGKRYFNGNAKNGAYDYAQLLNKIRYDASDGDASSEDRDALFDTWRRSAARHALEADPKGAPLVSALNRLDTVLVDLLDEEQTLGVSDDTAEAYRAAYAEVIKALEKYSE